MPSARQRLTGALAAGAVALGALAAISTPAGAATAAQPDRPAEPGRYEQVQLLSFNDFHGSLEPPTGSGGLTTTGHGSTSTHGRPVALGAPAGGVEHLATKLAQVRRGHPNSLTVAAGDLIGASPLLSAAFHDEPAVEALNLLGLDVSAVGSHELDEGYHELQRMAEGGCLEDGDGQDDQDSCPDGTFGGADFDWLAANVRYAGTDETILPPYAVEQVGGARIGFIGMTLEETPDMVTASGVAGLEFRDEVATANALVPELRARGVNAIVVLLHQGGTPTPLTGTDPATGGRYAVPPPYDRTCGRGGSLERSSPVLPIARNLDPAIDLVVSGHTHQPYVCEVEDPAGAPRLVTSASSHGRLVTETTLTYDKAARDVVRASVTGSNLQVTRDLPRDPAQTALIARYRTLVEPIAGEVLGSVTAAVTRATSTTGESALGDLVADAQLADDSVVTGGEEPVIAFVDPRGIRADLLRDRRSAREQPGEVTYAEAFEVQPANDVLVSMNLTGQQVHDVLRQQVTGSDAKSRTVLQVSEGFGYRLTPEGAEPGSVTLDGEPIDLAATYRVVTSRSLSEGGDGFPAFRAGTAKHVGGLDIDALTEHLRERTPVTPGPLDRIRP